MSDTKRQDGRQARGEITRRAFLGVAGAVPIALTLDREPPAAVARRIPIAVQMYSVRDDCKNDFDSALERVAAMGFEGVEFAGYYNYEGRAADLRKRLDALRLKAAGTHIELDTLQGDKLEGTIEFHQAIGCRFLIVPGNPAFTDATRSKALADAFNQIADRLKPLGMACGYHNHTDEFKKDGNETYWDLFAQRTRREVILQQDCGWSAFAGVDPVSCIRKYPGRTRTVHFKPTVRPTDTGKKAILGQDSVDWRAVYTACVDVGGTEWIVMEQETYPDGKTPMACTRDSFAALKEIVR